VSVELDHCVIAVTHWERSNAFYRDVIGAEVVARGNGYVYRLGQLQLNVHGPGVAPEPVARDPVRPGNSDVCFRWPGPIETAVEHLSGHGVPVELGPVPRTAALGEGQSVYFRDPDGSLMEFISYLADEPATVAVTGTGVLVRPADTSAETVGAVLETFAELEVDGRRDRWGGHELRGHELPTGRDASLELLEMADEAYRAITLVLADIRIAGYEVSRWELMSAPRRIELAPELRARLGPLRRG
jgi:catechol 2,3-dioxygenase-like lactoylglutathione lyase family enzyme